MSTADLLASCTNALIGGAFVLGVVLVRRAVTRVRRHRRLANRRFVRLHRADPLGDRRLPVPVSRRLAAQLSPSGADFPQLTEEQ
jgi:hypothetical protein